MTILPHPTKQEVEKYLNKWNTLENYVLQENSLDKLFFKTYPNNNDINDILIKCSSLNDFYSTNIYSIFSVAKHILNLKIDARLKMEILLLLTTSPALISTENKSIFILLQQNIAAITFQKCFQSMIVLLKRC